MTAKHLIATLALTLAAGAAFAAIRHAPAVTPGPAAGCETAAQSIPRVVVIAHRDRTARAEAPVPRVVITARRIGTRDVAAAAAAHSSN